MSLLQGTITDKEAIASALEHVEREMVDVIHCIGSLQEALHSLLKALPAPSYEPMPMAPGQGPKPKNSV